MEEFLAHPKVVGLAGLGPCLVTACYLDRVGSKYPYCKAHTQRLRTFPEEPDFDEERWRLTDKAICSTREVSLRGVPDRLAAEALYALSSRVDNGYKLRPECLRPLYDRLRAQQVTGLEEVTEPEAAGYSREQVTMIRAAQLALSRLNTTPETERVKDVWDMSVFGHTGVLPFTSITQTPLREAMKIWVYDDLPRRRNKNAVHHARAVVAALATLFGEPAPPTPRPRGGSGGVGAGRHRGVLQPHGPPHRDGEAECSPAAGLHPIRPAGPAPLPHAGPGRSGGCAGGDAGRLRDLARGHAR
ncbi:hypothetical protein NRF20_43195 [Streptomyces sp. R-74717]